MVTQELIRTKLQNKIFNKFAKTVTFISKLSPTYNDRGEEEGYIQSTSSVKIVPYNIVSKKQSYESFGELHSGDMDAAVPYDTTVDVGTYFSMEGINWEVKEVQPNYLPDNVVTIIRISKKEA